jgi:multidrug efflux system membrane fusion protein
MTYLCAALRWRWASGLAASVVMAALGMPLSETVRADASPGAPPPPAVTVAKPLAKRITLWDEYSGRFEAVQTVEVRPRVSGFVNKLHFTDGEIVKAGQLLFTIDPRPFELAVESAKADLARSRAQVDLAVTEVERARPLVKTGALTERELDQRAANLSVFRAGQTVAEAALKQAELNLEWTHVVAPIDGRISDRKVDAGNLVNGGSGTTTLLATIVTIDPIHFLFDISEADYLRYERLNEAGQRSSSQAARNPVRIRLADETEFNHDGKLDFLDNALNPRSGTLRARAVVPNEKGILQPGLFARVQLFGGEIDALLVPDSAIVSDQARKIVFVAGNDGVISGVPVTLGPLEGGLRAIIAGLAKTDRVVIDGIANPMVRPGAKITPEEGEIKMVSNQKMAN